MLLKHFAVGTVLFLSEIILRAQTVSFPILPGETVVPAKDPARSTFATGLRMSEEFDDNTLSNNVDRQASVVMIVEPHIGWTLAGSRAEWMLDYRPRFSKGYPISIYDSRSQLFDTTLQLQPAKRLKVRLRESFLSSKDIFDQLQQSEPALGSSVLDRPNSSVVIASRETNEQVGGDLTYALTPRAAVGTGGAFYAVSYKSAVDAQELNNANSIGTHAFLSYRSSRHNLSGLDYNFQNLTTQQGRSRALVQGVLYTDSIQVSPDMSFSFFIGPQHLHMSSTRVVSAVATETLLQAGWNWSGGGNYTWSGTRTALTVGISRRISDGAGVQGIVRLSSATAELRRQITKQWNGRLLVSEDRNSPIATDSVALSYLSFAAGLSRTLSQRLSVEFQYWRTHQTGSSLESTSLWADHNRIAVSFVYDVKRPLQR